MKLFSEETLAHYGIQGQKKGVRRWQYPDGRFNEEGKERYFGKKINEVINFKESNGGTYNNSDVVFISGKIKYDRPLEYFIKKEINKMIINKSKIIIGDAPGADKRVQDYLRDKRYNNVKVYSTDNAVRNNSGNWEVNYIHNIKNTEKQTRAQKDIKMNEFCTKGFVISTLNDDKDSATSNNIIRLKNTGKSFQLYDFNNKKMYTS